MIKCKETIALRKIFKELVVELGKNKSNNAHVEQMMLFIEDILRYEENEEKEEYKMN